METRNGTRDALSKEAYHWTRVRNLETVYVGGPQVCGGNSGNIINLLVYSVGLLFRTGFCITLEMSERSRWNLFAEVIGIGNTLLNWILRLS